MANILIIDDDTSVSEVLQRLLQPIGHDVAVASDGIQGLQYVAQNEVDLVIVDIFLPSKSGLEVIQELSADHPSVKVIAMTAFGAQDDIDLKVFAERYGAISTFEKPFNQESVVETVSSVLSTS